MKIKLTGWKALAGAIAIAVFIGFRYVTAVQMLDSAGARVIQQWITSEYQRYYLARNDLSDEDKLKLLLQTHAVDLVSIAARGKPESLAVRVEIQPNAVHPRDMPLTRYYKLEYSSPGGWRHKENINALRYHLTSFW